MPAAGIRAAGITCRRHLRRGPRRQPPAACEAVNGTSRGYLTQPPARRAGKVSRSWLTASVPAPHATPKQDDLHGARHPAADPKLHKNSAFRVPRLRMMGLRRRASRLEPILEVASAYVHLRIAPLTAAGAENVVGEHGDGVVDEAEVAVAAGVVGELLPGKTGDYRGPEVEVGLVAEPGAGKDGPGAGEDVDGDCVGVR